MEGEEIPEAVKKKLAFKRQFTCCSSVYITTVVTGMSWVLSIHDSSVYKRLINETIYSYAPSYVAITSFLTATFSAHFFGRRKTIIGMQLIYVGPLLITAASTNPIVHYAAALASKFGRDMLTVLFTLYTAEVSQAHMRAFFVGIYYVAFYVGVTTARFLPYTFQLTIFLSILLDAAALGLSIIAPETPHYLAMTDRADDAADVMRALWADTGDEEVNTLLEKAQYYTDQFQEGIFSILMSSRFVVPLLICFSYTMANYSICSLFYKTTRYTAESYGYKYMRLLFYPVISDLPMKKFLVDTFHIVGSFFFLLLSVLYSRRTIVFASLLTSLAYGLIFILAPLGPKFLVLVYTCTMCEHLGLKQNALILPTEIFPAVTRDVGVSMSYLFHYVIINQIPFGSKSMNKPYGWRESVSLVILVCFPLGIILIYSFMPETQDLPLTETEELGKQLVFQPLVGMELASEGEDEE